MSGPTKLPAADALDQGRSAGAARLEARDARVRVLVAESNAELAQHFAKGLEGAGFDVDLLFNAHEVRSALQTGRYAALVLSLQLPAGDSLAMVRELRDRNDPLSVLLLTARPLPEGVGGLRQGADDFLAKPFAFDELLARLQMILLRRPSRQLGGKLRLANVAFDCESRQPFVDEQPRLLTARESAVLEMLLRRPGNVIPKKQIEDHLFGLDGVTSNAVEVYVHRVRKRLAEWGAKVNIRVVRGIGYVIGENT